VLLLVITPLHPPVKVVDASQLLYNVFTAAWVRQEPTVRLVAQVMATAVAVGTVNVAEHVFTVSQSLVTDQITVFAPPQANGTPVLLLLSTPLHPPVKVAEASQLLYNVFTAAWVRQVPTVRFVAQLIDTAVTAGTVKVAVQVFTPSQVLVTVHITVFDPPQASGAPVLLLVSTPLHPPVKVVDASQLLYRVFTADWVRQEPTVMLVAQLMVTAGALVTVKVLVQVLRYGGQVLV
jgi:hypothetical protein